MIFANLFQAVRRAGSLVTGTILILNGISEDTWLTPSWAWLALGVLFCVAGIWPYGSLVRDLQTGRRGLR